MFASRQTGISKILNELWEDLSRGHQWDSPALNVSSDGWEVKFELFVRKTRIEDIKFSYLEAYQQVCFSCDLELHQDERRYPLREYDFGRFARMYQLSSPIDETRMDIKLQDGVLEVFMPWAN